MMPDTPETIAKAVAEYAQPREISPNLIVKGVEALKDRGIVEVFVPGLGVGYYKNPAKLAYALEMLDVKGLPAIYVSVNPPSEEVYQRSPEKFSRLTSRSKTADITKRVLLFIDVDPQRPVKDSMATDEEQGAAFAVGLQVVEYLRSLGWPDPIIAASGNGCHILFWIDLANDNKNEAAIKDFLHALARRFNTAEAEVDVSVSDAARLMKAHGTWVRKGENTNERPHRQSRILVSRPGKNIVPIKKILEVGRLAVEEMRAEMEECEGEGEVRTTEKMEEFLDYHDVQYQEAKRDDHLKCFKWIIECPWASEHSSLRPGTATAVFLHDNGVMGMTCHHAHCAERHWKEFRAELEKRGEKPRFNFGRPEFEIEVQPVTSIPEEVYDLAQCPNEALEGDYLGELAHLLSDGTLIPLSFQRASLKAGIAAAVDGLIAYPGDEDMHMRHYTMLISAHPGSGKDQSWYRGIYGPHGPGVLNELLEEHKVELIQGEKLGSGEYMVKILSRSEGLPVLAHFSELSGFLKKAEGEGSVLMEKLLELYDGTEAATGSFTNKEIEVKNAHFNFLGNMTKAGYDLAFSGKGSGSSGFHSRCILVYGVARATEADWLERRGISEQHFVAKIMKGFDRFNGILRPGQFGPGSDVVQRMLPRTRSFQLKLPRPAHCALIFRRG
jgi:hypothetical protein